MLLLLALLASLSAFSLSFACHGTCTWTGPGPKDPKEYGFSLYCVGSQLVRDIYNASSNSYFQRVEYVCKSKGNVQVADWDYLAPKTLEFGTPCNGMGYAERGCVDSVWALCPSSSDTSASNCRYMQSYDDCQWPYTFEQKNLPAYVIIYYKNSVESKAVRAVPEKCSEDAPPVDHRSVAEKQRLGEY